MNLYKKNPQKTTSCLVRMSICCFTCGIRNDVPFVEIRIWRHH